MIKPLATCCSHAPKPPSWLFWFLYFTASALPVGHAQITLANFIPDPKPVEIFLRKPAGQTVLIGRFSLGQVSGSFSTGARPTEFVFAHPSLGTNSIKISPSTNRESWLLYSVLQNDPATPEKGPVRRLGVQKLALGQNRAMGYRAFNVCTNAVSLLVDGKKMSIPPSSVENGSGFTELSAKKQLTLAYPDGSKPIHSNPERPVPICYLIYPKDEQGGFAWAGLTE